MCPGQINNEALSQVGDLGKAYANIPRGQFIGCFLQGAAAQKNRLADMDHEVVAHGRSDRDEGGQLPGRVGAVVCRHSARSARGSHEPGMGPGGGQAVDCLAAGLENPQGAFAAIAANLFGRKIEHRRGGKQKERRMPVQKPLQAAFKNPRKLRATASIVFF